MKIVYVIDSLASKGGAERILSDKMNYLSEHFGYDVSVITCYQDERETPNVYHLSTKVRQVNLRIPYYSQYRYRYPRRLLVKYTLYRQMCHDLAETIRQINPDVLVGLGYFMGDVVSNIKCNARVVIESHDARISAMPDQGLSRSTLSKLYMKFYRKRYFRQIDRNADVVVTLTNGDAEAWHKAKRVEVIPNFSVMPVAKLSSCEAKRVISVGRLEWQKGYDMLLEAWEKVVTKFPEWRLDIFGSGTLRDDLERQISSCCIANVSIHPFTSNISHEYSESSIIVASSRFEGFSLVLLEAFMHGVPGVAFDCPYGPADVIGNSKCGYLVENGNVLQLAEKIEQLIVDEQFRKGCSVAAVERAKFFDVHVIMERWRSLFEELASQRP